jgi:hypothetical protein
MRLPVALTPNANQQTAAAHALVISDPKHVVTAADADAVWNVWCPTKQCSAHACAERVAAQYTSGST